MSSRSIFAKVFRYRDAGSKKPIPAPRCSSSLCDLSKTSTSAIPRSLKRHAAVSPPMDPPIIPTFTNYSNQMFQMLQRYLPCIQIEFFFLERKGLGEDIPQHQDISLQFYLVG